jgi:hypothetical protein
MTKSSAIAQLRNRYDANVNGVQVVAGSNPATPTLASKFGCHTTLGLSSQPCCSKCCLGSVTRLHTIPDWIDLGD